MSLLDTARSTQVTLGTNLHACLPVSCPCVSPADLHGNFVRQFWRFQAKSKDVKGLKYLSLSKVAGDNIVWTSYAVYTDFEGLIKHARYVGLGYVLLGKARAMDSFCQAAHAW